MIEINALRIKLGDFHLGPIDLKVKDGEYFVILGPSGSGKTMLMETISGLYKTISGSIKFNTKDVTDMPPEQRGTGVVYQDCMLFPHMSVRANLAYSLKLRKVRHKDIDAKIDKISRFLKIEKILKRYPGNLSGGETQRVAFARALLSDPKVLLLDEPLTALDRQAKELMRQELKRIHSKTKKTIIHITHDFKEMEILAQRAAIMHNGKFIQIDTPENIMTKPANSFVADFIGVDNIIHGIADNGYFIPDDTDFKIPVSCIQREKNKGYLVIPCHEIEVVFPGEDTKNMFPATVIDFKSRPPLLDLFLKGGLNIKVTLPYSDLFFKKIQASRKIFIGIKGEKCHFMSQ